LPEQGPQAGRELDAGNGIDLDLISPAQVYSTGSSMVEMFEGVLAPAQAHDHR